jgi:hypothetical protein
MVIIIQNHDNHNINNIAILCLTFYIYTFYNFNYLNVLILGTVLPTLCIGACILLYLRIKVLQHVGALKLMYSL